jgi:hypothetical protein
MNRVAISFWSVLLPFGAVPIAVVRYGHPIAQADPPRAKGGGAARGVAGSPQSSTLFAGSLGGGVSGDATVGDVGAREPLGSAINAPSPLLLQPRPIKRAGLANLVSRYVPVRC